MIGAPQTGLRPRRQRGAALIVTMLLFAVIGITALLAVARGTESEAEKERRTSEALAMAKDALIGFAGGVPLPGADRPGDLPCPDLDNDGSADPPCSTAAARLGRLPWKTLGLPDLRDGDGERLWYAVANAFKNNPRTLCPTHTDVQCLNSDTLGTITVRDSAGVIVHDGTNTDRVTNNGTVAVVIAPGATLQRQGAGASQDRSCFVAGVWQCDAVDRCIPAPAPTDVPRCNPANYMDVLSGIEDNADFGDSLANGFITGPVVAASTTVVNDRILTIERADIFPVLERRVVQEVGLCLKSYATAYGNKFPWAADLTQSGTTANYRDDAGAAARRYGRIPDPPFNRTQSDDATMGTTWAGACKLLVGSWWTNWKSQVLYAVAPGFQPGSSAACGGCLAVNRPTGGPATNVRMVAIIAGRPLFGQSRGVVGDISNPANYVEFENATSDVTPDATFEIRAIDPTFNDRLAYSQ